MTTEQLTLALTQARAVIASVHDADCPHRHELIGNCCETNDKHLKSREIFRLAQYYAALEMIANGNTRYPDGDAMLPEAFCTFSARLWRVPRR